jgi:hypothetical protein
MARGEQKYLVVEGAVGQLVAMLRDGVGNGAGDEGVRGETWEILGSQYREGLRAR